MDNFSTITVEAEDAGGKILAQLISWLGNPRTRLHIICKVNHGLVDDVLADFDALFAEVLHTLDDYLQAVAIDVKNKDLYAQRAVDLVGLVEAINAFGADNIVDGVPLIHISVED